ncbi:MAG: hypothetical protein M3R21_06785 [Candidatus Dormibacteraeota bacterium]|nr:hypothetical protein [Candidatus Dormibacteraeota bacterium]
MPSIPPTTTCYVAAQPDHQNHRAGPSANRRLEYPTHLLNEGRMVLPGIQALFGFQLIAVFNQTFSQRLSPAEQYLHL